MACQPDVFADTHESLVDTRALHCVDGRTFGDPDPLGAILVDGPDGQLDVGIAPEHVRDFALEFDDFVHVVGEQRMVREYGAREKREPHYGQIPN